MRTGALEQDTGIKSADEESADKESRRIEFSSRRALNRDRHTNRCVRQIM